MIKTVRIALLCLVCLYFFLLVYWMFFGFGRSNIHIDSYKYNLKPLSTIKNYFEIKKFNFTTWAINIIGNIGVFVPFGLSLPIIFRFTYLKFVTIFGIGIFSLEVLQMVSKRGSFDIDDVILNTIGATIGFVIYKTLSIIVKRIRVADSYT